MIYLNTSISVDDLDELAMKLLYRFQALGYMMVEVRRNFSSGKYGYIYSVPGGKSYITGYGTKAECMKSLYKAYHTAQSIGLRYFS